MASGPRITIGSAVNNVALTATNSTTFTYSWNTSGVSAGSYTVTVTGTDLAGNTYAGSDKITITLDNTAPTVTLSDTDDDNLLAASDTVTVTALFNEAHDFNTNHFDIWHIHIKSGDDRIIRT